MKIKSYKIIESDSLEDLAEAINELLPDGWVPQGGVHYSQETRTWENERKGYQESETDTVCTQAMIQYYDEI